MELSAALLPLISQLPPARLWRWAPFHTWPVRELLHFLGVMLQGIRFEPCLFKVRLSIDVAK